MRLADLLFRQGHLSERSLIESVMTGDRPAHLDRCDLCAGRAVELGRWLDDTRTLGLDAADAAFPADRLASQHAQILRRLEQLDEPARVISFPRHSARLDERVGGRRVAASWVAVAAAAGLVIGVIGGQYSARLATPADSALADATADSGRGPVDTSYLQHDFDDTLTVAPLQLLDEITPKLVQTAVRAGG